MQVFIRNLNNKTVVIDCNKDDTIETIKAYISSREHLPVIHQSLRFDHITLENDKTLEHYKIYNHTTINLYFKNKTETRNKWTSHRLDLEHTN